jgi:hypothetical protein
MTQTPPWGTYEPFFAGRCLLEPGHFDHAKRDWVEDGRSMTVNGHLEFTDSRGVRWCAPSGSVVNGFSLPWWSPLIGTPFTGKGRRSSIIHDVACQLKEQPFADVHRAFYEGLITDGMWRVKAWAYGMAVKYFGPRWPNKD